MGLPGWVILRGRSWGRGKACLAPSSCFWRCSLPPGIPTELPMSPGFLPGSCLGSMLAWLFPPRGPTVVILALPGPLSSQGKLMCPRRGSGLWKRVGWEAGLQH